MLFMFDLGAPLRPPFIFLTTGVLAISAATVFTCMGKVWVRFNGWVYRTKEPRGFWGEVATLYFVGVCFIGIFLLAVV
jgi:hypothetical protein